MASEMWNNFLRWNRTDIQQIHRLERIWEYESFKLEQSKEAAYCADVSIDRLKKYSVQL